MTLVIWKKMSTCKNQSAKWNVDIQEKSHSVTASKELGKDAVQELNFTGCSHELFIHHTARTDVILYTLEQEWMLANLSQLHELITQALHSTRLSVRPKRD